MLNVGIMGAGHLGYVLAKRIVALGHSVKVANSRGARSLEEFAGRTGARAVDIRDIAANVDLLIMAIPLGQITTISRSVIESLPAGSVVVDSGNYVPPRDGAITEIDAGQAETAWVSSRLGVSVVKAFNNITDFSLEHNGKPAGARDRIALPVAGGEPAERAVVMRLVEELGFSAHDAGTLADSWRQQMGQAAYCTDTTSARLPELLRSASRSSVAPNRARAVALMKKIPADFPKEDLTRVARLMIGLDKAKPASWYALVRLGLAMLRTR